MAFLAKHQIFRCQRAQRGRGSSIRREILNECEGHKGNVYIFRTKGLCIKAPKGLQDISGVRINNDIITVMKRNTRKSEENRTISL